MERVLKEQPSDIQDVCIARLNRTGSKVQAALTGNSDLADCTRRLENADLPSPVRNKLTDLRSRTWVFFDVEHVRPIIDALELEAVELAGKQLTFGDFRRWHIIMGPEYVATVKSVLASVEETERAHFRDSLTRSFSSSSSQLQPVDEESSDEQALVPFVVIDDNGGDHRESVLSPAEIDECMARKLRRGKIIVDKTFLTVKLPQSVSSKKSWPTTSDEAERAWKRARGEDTQSQTLDSTLSQHSEFCIQTPEKWTPEKQTAVPGTADPPHDESPDVIEEYD